MKENNYLGSSLLTMKPRVNSAPEVLLVNSNKKRKPQMEKKMKNVKKSSQASISVDIFRSSTGFKNDENYFSISRNLSLVPGRKFSTLNQNKEKFEVQFCRINVLLITMQLGLGVSMSGLGVYLRSVSPSLTWKDCTYWAGLPLLCSGTFGLYFCLSDHVMYQRSYLSRLVKIICSTMSVITAALTLTASIMSGSHGKWISDFSSTCDLHFITEHSESNTYPEKCCEDNHTNLISKHLILPLNETQCVCKTAANGNFSLLKFEKEYAAVSCRYVFSALKDYFILQSSLMGVATGVCIWIVILHIRKDQTANNYQPHLRYRNNGLEGFDESPSPSFLRFFPTKNDSVYINNINYFQANDLKVPKVVVHDTIREN